MVHIHHSQPLKIKFGTNHFLGSETFGPIQYREGVKSYLNHSIFTVYTKFGPEHQNHLGQWMNDTMVQNVFSMKKQPDHLLYNRQHYKIE